MTGLNWLRFARARGSYRDPRTGQPMGERICGIVQRAPARRTAGWRDLPQPAGSRGRDRKLAPALQYRTATWRAAIPAASTGGRSAGFRCLATGATPTRLANHTSRGAQANAELTFTADHPMGADHSSGGRFGCGGPGLFLTQLTLADVPQDPSRRLITPDDPPIGQDM